MRKIQLLLFITAFNLHAFAQMYEIIRPCVFYSSMVDSIEVTRIAFTENGTTLEFRIKTITDPVSISDKAFIVESGGKRHELLPDGLERKDSVHGNLSYSESYILHFEP